MPAPFTIPEPQHQMYHAAAESQLASLRLELINAASAAREAGQRANEVHDQLLARAITWNRQTMEWVEGLLQHYNSHVDGEVGYWRRLAESAIAELDRTRDELAETRDELSRIRLEATRRMDHVERPPAETTAATTTTTDSAGRTTITRKLTTVMVEAPPTDSEVWALPFGCKLTPSWSFVLLVAACIFAHCTV